MANPLHVRFPLDSDRTADIAVGPVGADSVAKVENRTTLKILRKLIFGHFCCCVAFQRHYGGSWSILDETIWSLTSPRVKRISGSRNFRSPPQKDFCNNIGTFPTCRDVGLESVMRGKADMPQRPHIRRAGAWRYDGALHSAGYQRAR